MNARTATVLATVFLSLSLAACKPEASSYESRKGGSEGVVVEHFSKVGTCSGSGLSNCNRKYYLIVKKGDNGPEKTVNVTGKVYKRCTARKGAEYPACA